MHWMRWGLLLSLVAAQGSDLNLYTHRGKPTSYKALLSRAAKADIIFFVELHNSTEAHALQQQLLNDLIRLKNGKVLLG